MLKDESNVVVTGYQLTYYDKHIHLNDSKVLNEILYDLYDSIVGLTVSFNLDINIILLYFGCRN